MEKLQKYIDRDKSLIALLDIKIDTLTAKRKVLLEERRKIEARIRQNTYRL